MIPHHIKPAPGQSAHEAMIDLRNGHRNTVEYNDNTFTIQPRLGGWIVTRPDGKQCKTEGTPYTYTDILGTCAYLMTLD